MISSLLSEINDLTTYMDFIIEYFSNNLIDRATFERLLKVLILTQKGLSYFEIQ